MKTKKLLLVLLMLFCVNFLNAQMHEEWVAKYHGNMNIGAQGSAVATASANGYVYITGKSKNNTTLTDVFVTKLNSAGDVIWTQTYNGAINKDDIPKTLIVDKSDNVYVIGYTAYTTNTIFILKYNSSGTLLWSVYGNATITNGMLNGIAVSDNGNVYVSGYISNGALPKDLFVMKYNSAGTFQWASTYSQRKTSGFFTSYITLDANENVYVTGVGITDPVSDMTNLLTVKYDSSGTELWSSAYKHADATTSLSDMNITRKILVDSTGNVYITGRVNFTSSSYDIITSRISPAGDTLWNRRYNGAANGIDEPCTMSFDENGSVYVAGLSENSGNTSDVVVLQYDTSGNLLNANKCTNTPFSNGSSMVIDTAHNVYATGEVYKTDAVDSYTYTVKCNSDGEKIWDASYDAGLGRDFINNLRTDNNGNVYLIGESYTADGTDKSSILVKYCEKCNSIISGIVYNDANSNCVKDAGEKGLSGWYVKVDPGDYYATTDSLGYYCVLLPHGNTYTVSQTLRHHWGSNCPVSGNHSVALGDSGAVSMNNNFANKITTSCPNLWVDLSARPFRKCVKNTYSVNYCNNGTATASNVYIKIEFEEGIIPLSSTLNWSNQTGNIYTFNIGTLASNTCGTFYITDSVSCSLDIGRTLCNEARIYPDTTCVPVSGAWDKSSVKVTGGCVGDSLVCFTIENTGEFGNGNMDGPSTIRVYEDNVLFETTTFQLTGGETLEKCYPANGRTIRLEADQRPGHPGHSRPRESVEDCGNVANPSLFFITTVAEDDANDNVEIDCRTVVASFDPNEKAVKPTGITENKYVTNEDEMEYQVDFQNTGNDTAFTVIIRDTLSSYLDASTVVSGASSHPYTFKLYGQRVLEWRFENILLPDSNVNKQGSQGFVKFKVSQKANNTNGTLIENSAGIVFDFNTPVITNLAWNVVYDTLFVQKIMEAIDHKGNISIYPNPFTTTTTISIDQKTISENNDIVFKLYDILGKEVKKININNTLSKVNRTPLGNGIYFYRIESQSKIIGQGKLIID